MSYLSTTHFVDFGMVRGWGFGGGWGLGRKDGTGTADGGKNTRLDLMVDNDGPLSNKGTTDSYFEKRTRERSSFRVSENSRLGGSGLYHAGEKKEEKE